MPRRLLRVGGVDEKRLAPKASTKEACGEERYQRWSAYWSGATLDLHELYEWGYQDLRRINTRMWEIANELVPGAKSLVEVADSSTTTRARHRRHGRFLRC